VHHRVFLGVAAWLVGASAATGGSLLAVSVLGQGMIPSAGEQQSVATVNRALAKEAAERRAAMPRRITRPSARIAPPSRVANHTAPPRSPAAHPSVSSPSPGAARGTVLTSPGGTVVASCAGARAYLVSWSPQQGFGSTGVIRGPATDAQVTFTGGQLTVTMVVSCDAGVPTATATTAGAPGNAAGTFGGDGD